MSRLLVFVVPVAVDESRPPEFATLARVDGQAPWVSKVAASSSPLSGGHFEGEFSFCDLVFEVTLKGQLKGQGQDPALLGHLNLEH